MEGNAAHDLAEDCLKSGKDADDFLGKEYIVHHNEPIYTKEGKWTGGYTPATETFTVDDDMSEAVQVYLDYVRSLIEPGDRVVFEHRFDLSRYHPKFFGTADCVIIKKDGRVYVIDYKHGKGVAVDADDNPQLKYYALGAVTTLDVVGLTSVHLVIVQPRCSHLEGTIRTASIDALDLLDWAVDLVAAAKRTEQPDAPLSAGEWCKFCDAAAICPALQKMCLDAALADFSDDGTIHLPDPHTLGDNSMKQIIHSIDMIEDWCQRVREYNHAQALAGNVPDGFKLVNKRPQRKWLDAECVPAVLTMFDIDPATLFNNKLKSPAQIETVLKKDKKLIEGLYESVSSGTVLAPIDDKRQAAAADAADEFN